MPASPPNWAGERLLPVVLSSITNVVPSVKMTLLVVAELTAGAKVADLPVRPEMMVTVSVDVAVAALNRTVVRFAVSPVCPKISVSAAVKPAAWASVMVSKL